MLFLHDAQEIKCLLHNAFKQQDVGQENCFPDECHLKILKAFMDMAKRKINEKRFEEMNDL